MPDPLVYCNADIQYTMELVRRLSGEKEVSVPQIRREMSEINKQHPAMISEAGRKRVLTAVNHFFKNGIGFCENAPDIQTPSI